MKKKEKIQKAAGVVFVIIALLLSIYAIRSAFSKDDDKAKANETYCYDDSGDENITRDTETSFDDSSKTKYIIPDSIKSQLDENEFIATFENHLELNNISLPKEAKYEEKEGSDPLNFYLILDGSKKIEVETIENRYAFTNVD